MRRRVFEHGVAYICEKAVGPERSCDFRSGRMILQQPVEREQMQKLLATGRTDLLTNFMSKKNRQVQGFPGEDARRARSASNSCRAPRSRARSRPAAEEPA